MRLFTRDDLVEYVRARLGHPVIDLELELEEKDGLGHVHLAIQDSLDWMYRHNQNEANYKDIMILTLTKGIIEYTLPEEVSDVIDAAPTWGNGFTPWLAFDVGSGESLVATTGWSQFDLVTYAAAMRYLADVKKLVGQSYQVHYSPQQRKLRIYPTPKETGTAVMLEIYRKDLLSEVFANILFRDLVIARTRYIWGSILAKDDVTQPGGGKVGGSSVLALAERELEKAEKRIDDESDRPFILAL